MAINNYTELQSAITSWLKRDDLTSVIPDFISLCETYLDDDLRTREMIEETTVTPSQVNKYVDLPTGFLEPIGFVDDHGERLNQVHVEELEQMQYASSAGRPQFFSITDRINFERKASIALSYTMFYYKALDLATDGTNGVLTKHPNLYLYGSLIQAEPYLKNDRRITTWNALYEVALKKANNRAQQSLKKLRTDHPSSGGVFDINRGY